MVLFLGSKQLGLSALNTLACVAQQHICGIVTIDDSSDSRSVLPDFQSFADSSGLPLSVLTKPSELKRVLKIYKPSVVLVVGWYWIIASDLLADASGGFVGIHASLLPNYRGNAPLVWALINGESKTGITMFYFDDGIDTGDIVEQIQFEIGPEETIMDALAKVEQATIEVIERQSLNIANGTAPRRKQNHTNATYGSLRRPEDGRIDWSQSAQRIHNFIRAQTRPYPGAFTYLPSGKIVRMWQAKLFPYPFYGVQGIVGQRYESGIVVACGDGAIVIHEHEVEDSSETLKWGVKLG